MPSFCRISIGLICLLTLATFLGFFGMTPDSCLAQPGDASTPKGPIDTNRRGGVRSWRPGPTTTTAGEVRATQEALKQQGYDPGPVDGILGAKTSAALRAFQKIQGLAETGRLDSGTRKRLGL
jgi:peptidoglycan hydrolase-like protein with peptidoglycan-binding domain